MTNCLSFFLVQRQPLALKLDFCTVSKQQLSWLLPRIPQTRLLSMRGIDFGSCVIALASVNTPMLHDLDLSYVTGFSDGALYKVLSSPRDSRPGKFFLCFMACIRNVNICVFKPSVHQAARPFSQIQNCDNVILMDFLSLSFWQILAISCDDCTFGIPS